MKEFVGKRILIIVENLPCPFDRRVWQEALALKEKGASIFIICPLSRDYPHKFEVIDGITINRYNLPYEGNSLFGYIFEYSAALFWQSFLSLRFWLKNGFDVIHICNPPDLLFIPAIPFKLLGVKIVFDHHDLNPELFYAKYKKKNLIYQILLLFEKLTFQLADISIATNLSYKRIAITRGKKAANKVFVVRSGPSLERLKPRCFTSKAYKNDSEILVGYLGVMGKQEGLQYLIEACEYIVKDKKRKDIRFVCVGGGPELENYKKMVTQKKLNNYIYFTGRISDDQLLKILGAADICVNPDEYNEMNNLSTMNKIMEYMALGKPIVQFDLKEGKYSAKEASLYAFPNDSKDFAEKILALSNNPELRCKMGQYGQLRIKNELEWVYEKENLWNAYRFLFDEKKYLNLSFKENFTDKKECINKK